MIEVLTLTGIDASVDMDAAQRLWDRYPLVEFGVLVGSKSGTARHNRYPSLATVKRWRDMAASRGKAMALHLCGPYSRAVMQGTIGPALELSAGFQRVQVNATSYNYDQIVQFAEAPECDSVIPQRRYPPGSEPPLNHPKVEYLQDLSGGRGRSDFTSCPAPTDPRARWGYAGGLGPANIGQAIKFTDEFDSFRTWLDMEPGIRTPEDWMDLDRATAVCEAVFGD